MYVHVSVRVSDVQYVHVCIHAIEPSFVGFLMHREFIYVHVQYIYMYSTYMRTCMYTVYFYVHVKRGYRLGYLHCPRKIDCLVISYIFSFQLHAIIVIHTCTYICSCQQKNPSVSTLMYSV